MKDGPPIKSFQNINSAYSVYFTFSASRSINNRTKSRNDGEPSFTLRRNNRALAAALNDSKCMMQALTERINKLNAENLELRTEASIIILVKYRYIS